MKKIIIIVTIIIFVLSVYVSMFGGGKDLYEMLEGEPVLHVIVFCITSLSLLAMGYGIAIVLLTWYQALLKWLKR